MSRLFFRFDGGAKGAVWAVKNSDGTYAKERYATSNLIAMCNGAEGWREKVKDNIKYLIDTVGASGVYVTDLNSTDFDIAAEVFATAFKLTLEFIQSGCVYAYDPVAAY